MQNFLKWMSRLTAIFLAGVVAILLLSGTNVVSIGTVLVAVLLGLASQIGLFVSPSAVDWSAGLKKTVFVSMLPSVFWLIRQAYSDGVNVYRLSTSGSNDEILEHVLELLFVGALLVLYFVQSIRLSAEFLVKPAVARIDTSE
jgi:hypothetical protein